MTGNDYLLVLRLVKHDVSVKFVQIFFFVMMFFITLMQEIVGFEILRSFHKCSMFIYSLNLSFLVQNRYAF